MTIANDGNSLEHYGVKGQKWSVTRNTPNGATNKAARVTRKMKNQQILDARSRQKDRSFQLERQAFKTYSASGDKAARKAQDKYSKMEAQLLNNPDAKTASKMTSGEKAVVAGAYGGLALVTIGLMATGRLG